MHLTVLDEKYNHKCLFHHLCPGVRRMHKLLFSKAALKSPDSPWTHRLHIANIGSNTTDCVLPSWAYSCYSPQFRPTSAVLFNPTPPPPPMCVWEPDPSANNWRWKISIHTVGCFRYLDYTMDTYCMIKKKTASRVCCKNHGGDNLREEEEEEEEVSLIELFITSCSFNCCLVFIFRLGEYNEACCIFYLTKS